MRWETSRGRRVTQEGRTVRILRSRLKVGGIWIMKIKQPNWIPHGNEADLANRILSGNGARLYFHLYLRANRANGQIDLRYEDVATALGRKKRSIVTDFSELRQKGVCRVDSAVNQHKLVHVEICDEYWPFEKAYSRTSDPEAQYISQIRALLGSRACIRCDFGPSDKKFALELFKSGSTIEQIEKAISLGCSRKYTSLLNDTSDEPILRLAYFRDLIAEAGQIDSTYWRDIVNPTLELLEAEWVRHPKSASPKFASARRKSEKQTR